MKIMVPAVAIVPGMPMSPKNLLWIDCGAAAVGGVLVLSLSHGLSRLHGLPRDVLIFIGAASLVYATCGFALARREQRPKALIVLLATANAAWALVCVSILLVYSATASAFAVAHLLSEAAFVTTLAVLEWRWREPLRVAG